MNFSYWEKEVYLKNIDYLIIGMGLTGLQSAILLKESEPKARVIVCDRFAWSMGASTRNAGFACFANVSEILDDLKNHPEQEVFQLASRRLNGLKKLRKRFGDASIGYTEKGSREIFTRDNKADLEAGLDAMQMINTALYESCRLDRVFHFSNTSQWKNVLGEIHNAYEGQLNTGLLYRRLMEEAAGMGIELFGGLEYERHEEQNEGVSVRFKVGLELKTGSLLICTNGFTGRLLGEDVVPARGQIIVTEVLDKLPCEGLHHYDKGYYYWRDLDGRILLGGARNTDTAAEETYELEGNALILQELKRFLFEQICGTEVMITHEWSGIMGMGRSHSKNPLVKPLSENVYLAARLGGMGVALSANIAEDIHKLMVG